MKYTDLNVIADSEAMLERLVEMGVELGYSSFAMCGTSNKHYQEGERFALHTRTDLKARQLQSLKKEAKKVRDRYMIVAASLNGVDAANWVAEDWMVDVLTLDLSSKEKLRSTTAKLAAKNGTALEIPISSLLMTQGLTRSRTIKIMRDAVSIAQHAGMKIILSSGARNPFQLRSPRAMTHIGIALDLDEITAAASICENPNTIIERSIKRLDENHILPGLEIIGDDT